VSAVSDGTDISPTHQLDEGENLKRICELKKWQPLTEKHLWKCGEIEPHGPQQFKLPQQY
jgi:hypothetical protein